LRPEVVRYGYNLASALEEQQDVEEARELFQEVLQRDAKYPGEARKEAWRLATARFAPEGQGVWALHLARQARHREDAADVGTLDTLAAAFAAAGRFEEAARHAEKARTMALTAGKDELAARIQERVKLFSEGRRFIEDQ